jgi:glucose dehydrogenase
MGDGSRSSDRFRILVSLFAAIAAILIRPLDAQDRLRPSTARGEWPAYAGDLASSRYSPLDQIDRTNFADEEIGYLYIPTNTTAPDYLVDFTPELRGQAVAAVKGFTLGPLYTPPSLNGTLTRLGSVGGANWGVRLSIPKRGCCSCRHAAATV